MALHGIGHRRQAWYPVLDRLARQRDVILVDLPGHGESPPLQPRGRSVPQTLVDETLLFIDSLGLERPHFVGNSVGGRLALEAGVRRRAASVTAISPAGFWTSHLQLAYALDVSRAMEIGARLVGPLAPVIVRSTVGRALIYADIVARPSQVTPEQAMGDLKAYLRAIPAINMILDAAVPFSGVIHDKIPVTIAWGTKDRLLLPRQALVAKARLPKARLVPLRGCGHVPMTDDPAQVAEVLLHGSRIEVGQAWQRADADADADATAGLARARVPLRRLEQGARKVRVSAVPRGESQQGTAVREKAGSVYVPLTRRNPIAVRVTPFTRCNMQGPVPASAFARWRLHRGAEGVA